MKQSFHGESRNTPVTVGQRKRDWNDHQTVDRDNRIDGLLEEGFYADHVLNDPAAAGNPCIVGSHTDHDTDWEEGNGLWDCADPAWVDS